MQICPRVVYQCSPTRINNAASAQSALLLLRYCAVPAVSHLLRTVPTALAAHAFAAHENSVLGTVSKLIAPSDPLFRAPTDADLRDNFTLQHQRFARLQLQLSLKMGGCGIASTVMTAPLANIAASVSAIGGQRSIDRKMHFRRR